MTVSSTTGSRHPDRETLLEKQTRWNDDLKKAKSQDRVFWLWELYGAKFSCVNMSTALTSLAKWTPTEKSDSYVKRIVCHYAQMKDSMLASDAADAVAALTTMHFSGEEMNELRAVAQNKSLLPDSVPKLSQSFAAAGRDGNPLFQAIEEKLPQDGWRKPQEKRTFSEEMEASIKSECKAYTSREFVSNLSAFTNIQNGSNDFFQAMECEALSRLDQFTCCELALLASTFARALAGSCSFFSALEKKVLENINQFETRDLVMLYEAHSLSRTADGTFFSNIERELEQRGNLGDQELGIVIWSMLLARTIDEQYLEQLLDLLNQVCENEWRERAAISQQKLLEIEVMIKADAPRLVCKMKGALLAAIDRAKQESFNHPERSKVHIEVEEALQRNGYRVASQQFIDGLPVPIAILIPSENLAIEVSDKSYYYRTDPDELSAIRLMKKRVLESSGYRLLYVPNFEWSSHTQQQDLYLKELFVREYKYIAGLE